jgi:small subunit ribosomal protein S13
MSTEFNYIIRLQGKDLDGTKTVACSLTKIKGINQRLADIILTKSEISKNKRMGFLSEVEIGKIQDTINNIGLSNLPAWLLNRQKDIETGKNLHYITSDLDLKIKNDIDTMKLIKSWSGYRHAYGLKVRGQRTKTTNRKRKRKGVKKRRG